MKNKCDDIVTNLQRPLYTTKVAVLLSQLDIGRTKEGLSEYEMVLLILSDTQPYMSD
jgi:hypothetical protein